MVTLLSLSYLWLITTPQDAALLPSREPERALATMTQVLNRVTTAAPLADPDRELTRMNHALHQLERALTDGQLAFVNRKSTATFEREVEGARLFGEQPRLPPENKRQGNWRFEVQTFALQSQHLFVQAVTFKGSRTLRIKRVKLILFDGKHQSFEFPDIQGRGNGTEFDKRIYLDWMEITDDQGNPRVAKLKAIEITGSAQDGNFSATIDFKMKVPSYEVAIPTEALAIIARMKRHWRNSAQAAAHLAATRQNLEQLKRILLTDEE